jgi:uncharacterized protein with GYD domain
MSTSERKMMKFFNTILERLTAEAVGTVNESVKRLTVAEKLLILGLAILGIAAISTIRDEEKVEKDAKTSS